MKYSIIVPIYKVEPYLRECIESVLSQGYPNWELILVDDGSPDDCPIICDEYEKKDDRIKVLHKTNGGLVSARKAGLEIAKGDYVICVDGDDFLHKNCLSIINEAINEHKPDVLCFGYYSLSSGKVNKHPICGHNYGYYNRENMEEHVFPNLIHSKTARRFPPNVWSKVFKIENYRFYQESVPDEIGMGEDSSCSYPLICNANSLMILEECLYYYRQVPTSMTKVKKPLCWDNFDKVFAHYEEQIEIDRLGLRDQFYRARTHNLFNISMSQFYKKDLYRNVVSSIKNRFMSHPEYLIAIKESRFSSFQLIFARIALKHKLYFLMKLYSIMK